MVDFYAEEIWDLSDEEIAATCPADAEGPQKSAMIRFRAAELDAQLEAEKSERDFEIMMEKAYLRHLQKTRAERALRKTIFLATYLSWQIKKLFKRRFASNLRKTPHK